MQENFLPKLTAFLGLALDLHNFKLRCHSGLMSREFRIQRWQLSAGCHQPIHAVPLALGSSLRLLLGTKHVWMQVIAAINDSETVERKTSGGSHWSTLVFVRGRSQGGQLDDSGSFFAHLDSLSPSNQRVAGAFAPGLARLCGAAFYLPAAWVVRNLCMFQQEPQQTAKHVPAGTPKNSRACSSRNPTKTVQHLTAPRRNLRLDLHANKLQNTLCCMRQ
jgi:hypothetical protein